MKPLSDIEIRDAVTKIEAAPDAQFAFSILSDLSKRLTFQSCVVFEAVISVDVASADHGRKGDGISIVLNDRAGDGLRSEPSVFETIDPTVIPGARKFFDPPFDPFATGSNWYRGGKEPMSAADEAFYDLLDRIRGRLGVIVFPVRSAQTDFSPVACVSMESGHDADWLEDFLATGAPSVAPVISAFEEKLYPLLVEREIIRVNISDRELECLRLLAIGHDTKNVAHKLGVTPTMVSRHIRNAQKKLRVSNSATAVLKAQKLGLVRF